MGIHIVRAFVQLRELLASNKALAQKFAELECVEVWNIWLAESLSPDALRQLDHAEENVVPFYERLEAKLRRCRTRSRG
jgi:hypothetical protein